jgi:hypothetical protein
MFNLAIDSKLRGCDVVALKVEDIAPNGYALARATVRQRKTGRPVRFELTEQTRQAVDEYLKAAGKQPGEFLFSFPLFQGMRFGGSRIEFSFCMVILLLVAEDGHDAPDCLGPEFRVASGKTTDMGTGSGPAECAAYDSGCVKTHTDKKCRK